MRQLTILFALAAFDLTLLGCSANSTPGTNLTDSTTSADSTTPTDSTTPADSSTTTDSSGAASDGSAADDITNVDPDGAGSVADTGDGPDTKPVDDVTDLEVGIPQTDDNSLVSVGPDYIDGVSEDLNAVYVTTDGLAVWAVGDNGRVISRSLENGPWQSWQTRAKADLNGVGADADGEVFVVGAGGYIGRKLKEGFVPEASGTTENLNAVWFTTVGVQHQGFAVGDSGTLLSSSSLGDWWNMVAFTEEGELVSRLNDIHGEGSANDGNVFAVGDDGVVMKFNGKHWAQEVVETAPGAAQNLVAVTSHDGTFWAAGQAGQIVRRNDAAVWESQTSVPLGKSLVMDFTLFGGAEVVLALHAVMEFDGSDWVSINSSLTNPEAAASDATGIWVVGSNGYVTHLEPFNSL